MELNDEELKNRELRDYHEIFTMAGSIVNPEKFAYYYFKPYFGNLTFNEVRNYVAISAAN